MSKFPNISVKAASLDIFNVLTVGNGQLSRETFFGVADIAETNGYAIFILKRGKGVTQIVAKIAEGFIVDVHLRTSWLSLLQRFLDLINDHLRQHISQLEHLLKHEIRKRLDLLDAHLL